MKQADRRHRKRRHRRIRSLKRNRAPRATGTSRGFPRDPRGLYDSRIPRNPVLRGKDYAAVTTSLQTRRERRRTKLSVQTLIAAVLLMATYVLFQSPAPAARQAQSFVTEVMERDFNFAGVAKWYEANVGGLPAIIPAFKDDRQKDADPGPTEWFLPAEGKIAENYTADHPYVIIESSGPQVTAAAAGLVSFAGDEEGWGRCVIIQHAGDYETWYGFLENIDVDHADWIQPEQVLGKLGESDKRMKFGVKQGGQFVNPLDVIQID